MAIRAAFIDQSEKMFDNIEDWENHPKHGDTYVLEAEKCNIERFNKPFPITLRYAYISHNPLVELPIILPGSRLEELFVEHTNIGQFHSSLKNVKPTYLQFWYEGSPIFDIELGDINSDSLREWVQKSRKFMW